MRRALFVAALLTACGEAPAPGCVADSECAAGERCVDGACLAALDAAADPDSGADGGVCACGPGEVCSDGACAADCGDPTALACGAGRVCDFATGACADEGSPGLLTGAGRPCGASTCLPGTECGLEGACVPAPPCFSLRCSEDGATCWGRSCLGRRPAGACAPPSLERMNMDDFLRGGDGGAVDLEFDDACNAYVVTVISGGDYLRQLSPDGALTVWDGVTNLDMGEVAVRRLEGGEFGTTEGRGQVGLTYACCETCGCTGSDPQGVARLDRDAAADRLPMVIIATPSTGMGPFDRRVLDTGPYGLTWGRDNTLYVGNVTGQGDLVRANLEDGSTEELHRLPARIHASAVFDPRTLLVALDEGVVLRVSTASEATAPWADLGEDVTSLVRDPFTGRVYASVASGRVLELDADGTSRGEWQTPGERGRLAYAPDGALYYLVAGWERRAEVFRYPLPETR